MTTMMTKPSQPQTSHVTATLRYNNKEVDQKCEQLTRLRNGRAKICKSAVGHKSLFSGFFLVFLFRLCVAWDLEIEFECACDCLTERKERKEKASLTSAGDELGFSDRTLACSSQ
jgi:hypothetical protein